MAPLSALSCNRRSDERTASTPNSDSAESTARSGAGHEGERGEQLRDVGIEQRSATATSLKPKSMIHAAPASSTTMFERRRSRWAIRCFRMMGELGPQRAEQRVVDIALDGVETLPGHIDRT